MKLVKLARATPRGASIEVATLPYLTRPSINIATSPRYFDGHIKILSGRSALLLGVLGSGHTSTQTDAKYLEIQPLFAIRNILRTTIVVRLRVDHLERSSE